MLVGAGFSRNAERPAADTPQPPLWRDLASDMAAQLYRHDINDAPRDPLRLAEEYRTNFGQAALDEFVRSHIHDDAWEPGPLHKALMDLPWSDVLSTNWDTLLEKTPAVERRTSVRTTADLAHGHQHRIIKLHGTIGTSEHFILAEEDYRTYPLRFAAFVNTARQIFIENELCLIGFSGDDPNFLQWSGWVRDHLGDSARRIYLVGVLRLNQTKRKFLESRNIAPIDLAQLVEDRPCDEQQAAATALFLEFLAKAKPTPVHEWKPTDISAYTFLPKTERDFTRQFSDAEYAALLLDHSAKIWRIDRERYPAWLICPVSRRQQLQMGMNISVWRSPGVCDRFQPERRAEILYEIMWRHEVAHEEIDPQLIELLGTIADPARSCGLEKRQQLNVASALLRHARRRGDDAGFTRWTNILETHAGQNLDLTAEVVYQRCLRARDRLDIAGLATAVKSLEGPDPIWHLRRAALHCELGEFVEASALINAALVELNDRQHRDETSLWVRSRRAWAEWLSRATGRDWSIPAPWPLEFKSTHCDPEDEIEWIGQTTERALRELRENDVPVIPRFEPGHYSNPSSTVRFQRGSVATPLDTLGKLIEAAGLPLRLNYYDIIGNAAKDVAELAFEPTFLCYVWLLRSIKTYLDRPFDRYFGRVAIAQLPSAVAVALSERVTAAIGYWRERIKIIPRENGIDLTFAVDRLRLFIEVLARLSTRQQPEVARLSFDLAMVLVRDSSLHHPWLFEPIGNLANYAARAVPPANRSPLLLAAVEFPLSSEKGTGPMPWPNPIQAFFGTPVDRPDGDTRWTDRIKRLIHEVATGATGRPEAALRLYYLSSRGALTDPERGALASALWPTTDRREAKLPEGTNLLPHAFLEMPAPAEFDCDAMVRARLFDIDIIDALTYSHSSGPIPIGDTPNQLHEIVAAAQSSLRPRPDQAALLFSRITEWRPPADEELDKLDPMAAQSLRQFYSKVRELAGLALARIIVPSLNPEDFTEERARALLTLISTASVHSAIAALPYFRCVADSVRSDIIQRIRRAIVGRKFEEVAGSVAAVETWATLDQAPGPSVLPQQLIDQVISAVETQHGIGLHGLIHCARKLVEMNKLKFDDKLRLSEALGDLAVANAYERIDFDSREATSVSLVRAECVQLARALENTSAGTYHTATWLNAVEMDPLPEVRYALARVP